MTISLQSELVEEIARDHSFDAGRLHVALTEAVRAHEEGKSFWEWRREATASVAVTEPVLTAVRRAIKRWEELPPNVHREVANFVDPGDKADPVEPRLRFVAELLEEYSEHYRRPRGNPGYSRSGGDHDLRPLQAFADVLMEFWLIEKGTPFGHVVERYEEAAGFDPIRGDLAPRVAESDAMEFLIEASACLPQRYRVSNFETVVRRIKEKPAPT